MASFPNVQELTVELYNKNKRKPQTYKKLNKQTKKRTTKKEDK